MAKNNSVEYPIAQAREELRQRAEREARTLSRSVGRVTSCDLRPCREYGEEVALEYATVNRLLYLQQCRLALERAVAGGRSRLRYRWADGRTTDTVFRRVRGRVRISGLVGDAAS